MQANATGFYWIPAQDFIDHINSLPPTLESIKALALTLDRQLALLLMARATDNSRGMSFPIIDRDYIRTLAPPLRQCEALRRQQRSPSDFDISNVFHAWRR